MNKKNAFIDSIRHVLDGRRECLHLPEGEVEPGEEVLGILENETARALHSLLVELNKANKVLSEQLNHSAQIEGGITRQTINRMELDIHQARNQCEVVGALFWEMVHLEFPKSRLSTVAVGIREGWKVVIFMNGQPSLFDIMARRHG